tara:strand:- start:91 stop:828 length:738 start_codon:yes stop_codon:yes gene_type:complete
MLAGIKDILIIVNKGQVNQFRKVLSDGKRFGIKLNYKEQTKPRGLPDAFILGEKFIGKNKIALILGDNFFYGQSLTTKLRSCIKLSSGCKILVHPVNKPELYGVAELNNRNKIMSIKEKPKKSKSKLAITGLYFFDNKVIKYSKLLKPSKRNELEIVDLLNKYRKVKKLNAEFLGRGGAWLDSGSIDDFYNTSSFVSSLENRQGLKIACLEEIALNYNWINKKDVKTAINFYGNCLYSNYLKKLI